MTPLTDSDVRSIVAEERRRIAAAFIRLSMYAKYTSAQQAIFEAVAREICADIKEPPCKPLPSSFLLPFSPSAPASPTSSPTGEPSPESSVGSGGTAGTDNPSGCSTSAVPAAATSSADPLPGEPVMPKFSPVFRFLDPTALVITLATGSEWQNDYRTFTRTLLAEKDRRIAELEGELLRVRTTGHAAAHELDNIAVESGIGHSPKPGTVAEHVRQQARRIAELEAGVGKTAPAWTKWARWYEDKDGRGHYESLDRERFWLHSANRWHRQSNCDIGAYAGTLIVAEARAHPPTVPPPEGV
jgi:hypothetical protein